MAEAGTTAATQTSRATAPTGARNVPAERMNVESIKIVPADEVQ